MGELKIKIGKLPPTTPTPQVSKMQPSVSDLTSYIELSPHLRHSTPECTVLFIPDWDLDSATMAVREPVQTEEKTTCTHYSPDPLERDLKLSDSTDPDISCSIDEEILLLHREAKMSPKEKAMTVVQKQPGHLGTSSHPKRVTRTNSQPPKL